MKRRAKLFTRTAAGESVACLDLIELSFAAFAAFQGLQRDAFWRPGLVFLSHFISFTQNQVVDGYRDHLGHRASLATNDHSHHTSSLVLLPVTWQCICGVKSSSSEEPQSVLRSLRPELFWQNYQGRHCFEISCAASFKKTRREVGQQTSRHHYTKNLSSCFWCSKCSTSSMHQTWENPLTPTRQKPCIYHSPDSSSSASSGRRRIGLPLAIAVSRPSL